MKDGAGEIVAVDFGGYSFLPRSFFIFALERGGPSALKQHLATVLENPKSVTADVLVSASCALVPYSSNNVGEQISLLSFRLLVQCAVQVFWRRSSPGFLSKRGARVSRSRKGDRTLQAEHRRSRTSCSGVC